MCLLIGYKIIQSHQHRALWLTWKAQVGWQLLLSEVHWKSWQRGHRPTVSAGSAAPVRSCRSEASSRAGGATPQLHGVFSSKSPFFLVFGGETDVFGQLYPPTYFSNKRLIWSKTLMSHNNPFAVSTGRFYVKLYILYSPIRFAPLSLNMLVVLDEKNISAMSAACPRYLMKCIQSCQKQHADISDVGNLQICCTTWEEEEKQLKQQRHFQSDENAHLVQLIS